MVFVCLFNPNKTKNATHREEQVERYEGCKTEVEALEERKAEHLKLIDPIFAGMKQPQLKVLHDAVILLDHQRHHTSNLKILPNASSQRRSGHPFGLEGMLFTCLRGPRSSSPSQSGANRPVADSAELRRLEIAARPSATMAPDLVLNKGCFPSTYKLSDLSIPWLDSNKIDRQTSTLYPVALQHSRSSLRSSSRPRPLMHEGPPEGAHLASHVTIAESLILLIETGGWRTGRPAEDADWQQPEELLRSRKSNESDAKISCSLTIPPPACFVPSLERDVCSLSVLSTPLPTIPPPLKSV
eukprot:1984043-Rhodomonas_salina.2